MGTGSEEADALDKIIQDGIKREVERMQAEAARKAAEEAAKAQGQNNMAADGEHRRIAIREARSRARLSEVQRHQLVNWYSTGCPGRFPGQLHVRVVCSGGYPGVGVV